MIRKKLFLFVICFVCFFFIISGVFGDRGYLYNRSLKQQIIQLVDQAEELGIEVSSLTQQTESLETEEGIRDAAMKLGYVVKTDNVWVFEDPQLQEGIQTERKTSTIKFYQPLSSVYCLLIASLIALVVTLFSIIWSIKKENLNDSEKNKSGDYTDPFIIDG